ncbi:histidine kinase [Fulvivirgaceae bacterium BMA12]|uniref:Histidine kinase n=1 Tax=Agaribacillus aureus TaxID=3051825 RepID=A0ABT8L3F3_9BACT|nr:histidine kinase [Fulvivirgaceae bacterium BMA12]
MFKLGTVPGSQMPGTLVQIEKIKPLKKNSIFWVGYRYIYILLLALYSYLNILFTEGDRIFGFDLNGLYLFSILLVIVILVWEGNRRIAQSIFRHGKRYFLEKFHPLVVHFFLSLVVVGLAAIIPVVAVIFILSLDFDNINLHTKLSLGFAFRINLFLNSINAIVFFMSQLKETQVEAEKFKKQSVEAQFEALRNQINPHFLFNSFNVLSNLVYKDPDTSSEFIQQLSKVYRYLLKYQEQKVVSVKEELEFLKSYIYLLSIRFEENLFIKNNLQPHIYELYIAPASLQLLIENAIKHNVVSIKKPLIIELFNEDKNYLVVKNNLQPKTIEGSSTSVGLKNISGRYRFISEKQVTVHKTEDTFFVKVPLIHIETK